ncbi:MAG: AAA family ATPase [Deltaproteobacteria bacterium]|nr:AAA family ATPase [Deltaproteobacteria bacterium]
MYTDFFHFREEPFQVTPNPRFLFLSNVHKEAIQKLVDGIRRRKGFIELVGMAGTGKTLLCKELIQILSAEMDIAYIFYPVLDERALYFTILKQWGIPVSEETSVPALLEKISGFLRERFEKGRNALIIIDEAHRTWKRNLKSFCKFSSPDSRNFMSF